MDAQGHGDGVGMWMRKGMGKGMGMGIFVYIFFISGTSREDNPDLYYSGALRHSVGVFQLGTQYFCLFGSLDLC